MQARAISYQIDFEPAGKQGKCPPGQSLLSCAREMGLGIVSICSGRGTCHSCRIRLLRGDVTNPTTIEQIVFSPEEIDQGWRLACQTYPVSDCRVAVPSDSLLTYQRTDIEGLDISVRFEPAVRCYRLSLSGPSLLDNRADAERLLVALTHQFQRNCRDIDIDVLKNLSSSLRLWDWQCLAAVRHDEVVSIGRISSRCLGLAIDVGTTNIAGYLVDLNSGQTLIAKGITNPQISYGGDIISRINFIIKSPLESKRLQELAVNGINRLARDLCTAVNTNVEEIVDTVIVGNTAMHHLLLCLPVKQLVSAPFTPAVSQALDLKVRDLNLNAASGSYLHLLPNIAGFVGADHVAVLLTLFGRQLEGPTLVLDIGTNTEISLLNEGRITSVSCASGPAFEGSHIKNGMLAIGGAIERLQITANGISYQTIGAAEPSGLCGSGILDAVSELYVVGILSNNGRMNDSHPRVRDRGQQREFVLVSEEERNGRPAISITQHDVREVQMAKAAIRAGIQVLLGNTGTIEEELRQVVIAGDFGSYINISSAINIGLFPALPLDRYRQIGNAAGLGAKLALVCYPKRAEARRIAAQVNYFELAKTPNFQQTFLQSMRLGKRGKDKLVKGNP